MVARFTHLLLLLLHLLCMCLLLLIRTAVDLGGQGVELTLLLKGEGGSGGGELHGGALPRRGGHRGGVGVGQVNNTRIPVDKNCVKITIMLL